jgi:hypothetical protein
MSREEIERAVKHFGVPADKEEFLFVLPGFYVGAADGNLDAKEVVAVVHGGAVAVEVVGKDVMEPEALAEFLAENTVEMVRKCSIDDVDILMRGIKAKLEELPSEKANMVRGMVRVVIMLVAAISGRKKYLLWGSRIDKSEEAMIDRIASYL